MRFLLSILFIGSVFSGITRAEETAIIRQLQAFAQGPEQEVIFLKIVEDLQTDSFATRERATMQLTTFPSLPDFQRTVQHTSLSPGAQLKLAQWQTIQSPNRTHALLRDLLETISQEPADIPIAMLFRVIDAHQSGLHPPLALAATIAVATTNDGPFLREQLQAPTPLLRISAAHAFIRHFPATSVAALSPLLADADEAVRLEVAFLLLKQNHRPALPVLIQLTDARSDGIRWRSKQLLSKMLNISLQEEQEPRTNFSAFWTDIVARNPNKPLRIPDAMPTDIPLFEDAALSGWTEYLNGMQNEHPKAWRYHDGVLHCNGEGSGYLVTQQKFRNYELSVEWKGKGDSGIGIMATRKEDNVRGEPPYLEVQTLSGAAGDLYLIGNFSASNIKGREIAFRAERTAIPVEEPEWQSLKIRVNRGTANITINGTLVNTAKNATQQPGYIILRNEGNPVSFRNLLIRPSD